MSKITNIKVGFLASYDYEYLKTALPFIYDEADSIAIAIDKDRRTWSGNTFYIDLSFFDWLAKFDVSNKIRIYEDQFFNANHSPMECETIERNKLAIFLGEGGWHVQLDSDEFCLDFEKLTLRLKQIDVKPETHYQVYGHFISLFKKNEHGYFVINGFEKFAIATNTPNYVNARNCNHDNIIEIPCRVIHQSWARPYDEIVEKTHNWGHKNDFDVEAFIKLWAFIDEANYKYIRDFHPISPRQWSSMCFIKNPDIDSLINKIDGEFILNNRVLSYSRNPTFLIRLKRFTIRKFRSLIEALHLRLSQNI